MRRFLSIAGVFAMTAVLLAGHLPAASAQSASSMSSMSSAGSTSSGVTICHHETDDPDTWETMIVTPAQAFLHFFHGDSLGACAAGSSSMSSSSVSSSVSSTGSSLSSSSRSSSLMSSRSSMSSSVSSGDTDNDDDDDIFTRFRLTICHNPDGDNPQTLRVPLGAALAHFFHGDDFGRCDNDNGNDDSNGNGNANQRARVRSNADTDVDVDVDADANSNVNVRQNGR